jgi:hypothetical protein
MVNSCRDHNGSWIGKESGVVAKLSPSRPDRGPVPPAAGSTNKAADAPHPPAAQVRREMRLEGVTGQQIPLGSYPFVVVAGSTAP